MDTRGHVLIRGLWEQQTDAIIDIKLSNADANTYRFEPMDKLLARWEKTNKDKHSEHCHKQWKYFPQFVIYVDGMIGKESLVILTNLIRLMAEKMDEPISHVHVWINGRSEIAAARSYSQIICGDRLPSPLRDRDPDWDPASVFGLAQ